MSKYHTVSGNESVGSIAEQAGHFAPYIWNLPENKSLRDAGRQPTALLPGDKVFVPDLRDRHAPAATGNRHVFLRKGVPGIFRLRILKNNEPLCDEVYELEIDQQRKLAGKTDANGWLEEYIPLSACEGTLHLPGPGMAMPLQFGMLVPATELSGQLQRLQNLGYLDDTTQWRSAVRKFQREHGLPETGAMTNETRDMIAKVYEGDAP